MRLPTPPMEEWDNIKRWRSPDSIKPMTKTERKRMKEERKKKVIMFKTPM